MLKGSPFVRCIFALVLFAWTASYAAERVEVYKQST